MESCKFDSAAIMCVPQIVTYEKEIGYKASEDTIVRVLIVAAVVSKKARLRMKQHQTLKESGVLPLLLQWTLAYPAFTYPAALIIRFAVLLEYFLKVCILLEYFSGALYIINKCMGFNYPDVSVNRTHPGPNKAGSTVFVQGCLLVNKLSQSVSRKSAKCRFIAKLLEGKRGLGDS